MPERVQIRFGIKIPLRDGVHLSGTLYQAADAAGPAPCLLAMTPYATHRNHPRALLFTEQGYVCLIVDVRGRGNSEGEFRPLHNEADDGFDIVEWIAAQSFCDGRVGMFSGSYEGYVQWATARRLPPHLWTIAPGMAAAPGIDFPMRNNIGSPYIRQWLALTAGRTFQQRIFEDQKFWRGKFREWYEGGLALKELDAVVGSRSEYFQEWSSHNSRDAYWESCLPTEREFAAIDLPILTLTGCYDADQPGALFYYREHTRLAPQSSAAKHYLIIGPWDHASTLAPRPEFAGIKIGAAGLVDVLGLLLQWYDWLLRGASRPPFLKDRVAYYVMGAEAWRYAPSLDAVSADRVPMYLDSIGSARIFQSGSLSHQCGQGSADAYVYDPTDRRLGEFEGNSQDPLCLRPTFPTDNLTDQGAIFINEDRQLVYHTEPFVEDLEVSGFFELSVWLSIDTPDTGFTASVYEIDARGNSILLTCDWMRARYREGLDRERLIDTTEPLHYRFERFTFISRLITKGNRLRMVFGPLDSIYSQRIFNSASSVLEETVHDARTTIVRLFHDPAHPSVLHMPVGTKEN